MSTDAQQIANRANALSSTGPISADGKSRVSRNALTSGLFSSTDFVHSGEQDIYAEFCAAYEADLAPIGAIERTFAAEILHAAWRLRRCSTIEAGMKLRDGDQRNEKTQLSVDRARAAAHRIFSRSLNELRKVQKERRSRVSTKQTQSEAPTEVPVVIAVPRSAPCTCGSGIKYKRCCGKDAPPVLGKAA